MFIKIHILPFNFARLRCFTNINLIDLSKHLVFLLIEAFEKAGILHAAVVVIGIVKLISFFATFENSIGFQCFEIIWSKK